ncbi:MAG: alpha-2-macroglobulin family protein [Saprospiraceae bacterium]
MKQFLYLAIAVWISMSMSCKIKSGSVTPKSTVDIAMIQTMWKTIDSLEQKGLVSSALKEVQKIKKAAFEGNDSGQLVKAIVYENRYLIQLEEDSNIKTLDRVESEVNSYPEPARSVLHSFAAQWYTQYLQSHLWELRNRTEFGGPPGPDIRTWGIRHFLDKIQSHYALSVQWEGLRTAKVEDYEVLLTEKQNTDDLRPTLYDILMHRALDYYSGTETYLTKPVYDFVLTDPLAFAPARSFIGHSFPVTDSLSNTWKALQWYQLLLAFRLNDDQHEAALVDADLKRLRFVYDNIIIDGKDSIYQKTLDDLAQSHHNSPESALVDYYRAELLVQKAGEWSNDKSSSYRFGYNDALKICLAAIEKYPDAYGSQLCKTLISQVETKNLSASAESINLPGEELLIQIQYRNLPEVHLKLAKLPNAPRRWRADSWNGEEILRRLNQLTPLKTWQQAIDNGGDHQPHTTEIGLPSLQVGHYALLVSDMDNFDIKRSTTGAIMFTVSELGYWYIDDRQDSQVAAILNRKTGLSMKGVKAEFYTYQYNPGRQKQDEIKVGEGVSNEEGWVSIPKKDDQSISIRLSKGDDELFEDEYFYTYRYGGDNIAQPTTLFFSDRSIYRPGQKIFFKGYALNFDKYRIPSIVPNKNIEVILYDVNGQEQSKQTFTSNAYGTFFGHFDLPQGGLSGQMSISSSYGSTRHYFQVEEYKRPKFEVKFDTLKETVSLNENVTIKGFALDYAGSPVSSAVVKYRVERVSFRPWWYGYWKGYWPTQEDRQVLVVGSAMTKDDGSFDATFLAKSKAGGDPNLMYRFETTVFVTDLTGESHEATKTISLNKQGYEVNINLSERIAKNKLNKISVSALNSDGANVKVNGEVEVSLLKGPSQNKRERLWTASDILTITADDYSTRFMNYHIPGKEQMAAWDTDHVIGKKSYTFTGTDTIDVSSLFSGPGYYKLAWTWKDANGKTLPVTQYVMVYESDKNLPGQEVIQVAWNDKQYQPNEVPDINLLTGLSSPPKTIRIIERRKNNSNRNLFVLPAYHNTDINITEDDRGGIYMHYLTAYNNRFLNSQYLIQVPWTTKDLDVKLKTWRDKMEPGDEETWTMTVTGSKHEPVTAEMLLSMYDASLDAFIPHQWQMSLYPSIYSTILVQGSMAKQAQYWGLTDHWEQNYNDVPWRQYRDLNAYGYYPEGSYGGYPRRIKGELQSRADGVMVMDAVAQEAPGAPTKKASGGETDEKQKEQEPGQPTPETQTPPALRSALEETVFFYPDIKTDVNGNLSFSFKMKEGLTRWKFQALAHTKDLAFGLAQAETVTQKQLMVFPNPPRFFREGDTIAFQIKATNLTTQIQTGSAQLKIVDAFTDEDVSAQWKIGNSNQQLKIGAGLSTPLSWTLQVPKTWIRPVKYQVSASAGTFTDGEEAMLPVVTNRILVTETLPLPIKAKETRTFVFKSMQANSSSTLTNHQFVVEMTTSPAWYAVQALPYLMEYPHECAEQIFSRLYANSLGAQIVTKYPAIKRVFDGWKNTNDDALLSNLEKNQELKSAMLEETPWVRDAMGETTQKKDIALLFETNKLRNESQQALLKLRQMQMSNGAFPWFPAGQDNWYITQYIVEGFGHLKKMGVSIPGGDAQDIIQKAIPYLDGKMIQWYEELKRLEQEGKIKMSDHQIGSIQVHYLYTRSFFPEINHVAKLDEVMTYLKTQSEKYWLQHGIYEQGLMALGFYRNQSNNTLSKDILASLRERTITNDELGRYWKITPGYFWYEAPVELQSLMIELFQDMKVPQAEVDELRVWLLKQKQTTQWKSTKATASAIYALLIHPDAWLEATGIVEVKLGGDQVIGQNTPVEAGTGYVKKSWDGDKIKDNWSTITVSNPNNHIAWGAAYWQYWEDLDNVKNQVDNNPLKVTRQLLISHDGDRGAVTTLASGRALKVGDKLVVRLILETDRPMEFVHLKDLRASGFEPMDVISGYHWSAGLAYYQSTKDLATHFFIDFLPRGKFVVEYPVTVAQAGSYSEGLATLQCMYAPEFASHSEGSRVKATQK